jgi:DNA processing protein
MIANGQLSDEERLSWLQLTRTEGIGPLTFNRLLQAYGTATKALAALPELGHRGGKSKPTKLYPRDRAVAELEAAAAIGARWVALTEADYPLWLKHVAGAPTILCLSGRLELATRDAVGIVGARNASASGRKFARMLSEALGQHGFVVASGLARGIDTAAHEAALPHATAAVVAGGIDHFYPPENAELQKQIGKEHLLISEMPLGAVPKAEHFPRRNRIISGMSRAVIVVEAALQSGSLITARFANEQGREVFAVPGSPLDPRCAGCNKLIRDGANLLSSIDDVLEALNVQRVVEQPNMFMEPPTPSLRNTNTNSADLVGYLSPTPIHIDDLIRETRLDADVVTALLLELEVAGRVVRSAGGEVALVS